MPDATIVTALTALGSAAVGAGASIAVNWVKESRDRRTSRADVLNAFGDVERLRWHDETHEDFSAAVRALRAAALIAQIPRPIVEYYILMAAAARFMSLDDFDSNPTEGGGSIWAPLSNMVKDAGEILVQATWHRSPYARHQCRKAVRRAEAVIAAGGKQLQLGHIDRARRAHF